MTEQSKITAPHATIYSALAAAQAQMGKALKQANNPHFRSKYADLGNVMDACLPALNQHGIAVVQPTVDEDGKQYVKTILLHESGEHLECRVPLILQKTDMQGYGSAVTYARRYGLMCMTGVAPEDDDGNAAAAAALKNDVADRQPSQPARIGPDQFVSLKARMDDAGVTDEQISQRYGVANLEEMPIEVFQKAMAALKKTIDAKRQPVDDEIPY